MSVTKIDYRSESPVHPTTANEATAVQGTASHHGDVTACARENNAELKTETNRHTQREGERERKDSQRGCPVVFFAKVYVSPPSSVYHHC